jgi:SAM-dependent methyltransferase
LIDRIPENGRVIDVGCGDFSFFSGVDIRSRALEFSGCDIQQPTALPSYVNFAKVDLSEANLPYPDDWFDFVVLSHVLEHLRNPVEVFGELLRILKPGGILYFESPSERSVWPPPWAPAHWNLILSFYDDPTHVGRPWSPQAIRRLAIYHGCEPLLARYDFSWIEFVLLPINFAIGTLTRNSDQLVNHWWRAIGWETYAAIRKPPTSRGNLPFHYFSFKGKEIGPRFKL